MKPDFSLCLKCKGRLFCGLPYCPLIAKANAYFKASENISNINTNFSGSSQGIFVGHYNYPKVNFGILAPNAKENSFLYNNPKLWSENNFSSQQVISLRSSLINSRQKKSVFNLEDKTITLSQEIAMAKIPAYISFELKKKPKLGINIKEHSPPIGPLAELKHFALEDNPKTDKNIEKAFYDTDLKSSNALTQLYKKGYDENTLAKILSAGMLGIKKQRKLVPTRWSITAVHNNIANSIIAEIKHFSFSSYAAYFGSYLGNYYLFLFFPEPYSYELFETYMPNSSWNMSKAISYTTDYEPYSGRKSYAENCAGGFYSVRLSLADHMKQKKIQASVIAIRIITEQYSVPLGVWVTAEASRKSLNNKPFIFSSKELMLKYALALIKKKFSYDISFILNKSIILKSLKSQKKLSAFL